MPDPPTPTTADLSLSTSVAPEQVAAIRACAGCSGKRVPALLAKSGELGVTQSRFFLVFAVLMVALSPLNLAVPDHRGNW